MAVDTNIYDNQFFKNTIKFEADSAKAATDILIKYFKPKNVIDVGCGAGIYLREFMNQGVEVLGYDGSPAALKESLIGDKLKLHDLSKPLKLNRKFDLCLCFEVAEHIENKYSEILVKTLINLSDDIVFTAATPGQGPESIGHINEQPHKFWINLFKEKGFSFNKKLTETIKKEMEAKKVVWWITKNLMILNK
ncbi:class I SAM-dependent methyltransferase [Candidatus Falkowbacteria bacterium]|jgi:2-polyprenyl-3-methyl-5-hydroxy-6-metoxy-1,4-benzoquinol methylase|nr:class I SAM-dependent methyltransferase [Candidatus Falkowbacteria bacterium]MBT4433200.1 class I SAM-dependent methyltransferase [Candidatus Falkowbacteria bacterium]